MKIGLVGVAVGAEDSLYEAVEFLMGDVGVDLLVYLGSDDAIVRAARKWAEESIPDGLDEDALLTRIAAAAPRGSVADLDLLFEQDASLSRVELIRRLPPAPARAIEMIGDRIITLVWDKGVLQEEDIANSFFTVYGKSRKMLFKRFGPRYFFTPGPLSEKHIGVLEHDEKEGGFVLSLFSPDGVPISREVLQIRASAKLTVTA
jgi:hypothetical protein